MNEVATLTIASDDHPWVSLDALDALEDQAREIGSQPGLRAVLLVGGSRHFCSGAPVHMLTSPDAAKHLSMFMRRLPQMLFDLPVPVLAVMRGHAVGGGWMTGLWADRCLMSTQSLYGANFTRLGLSPGMGATQRLPAIVGHALAHDMLFGGGLFKGRELLHRAPQLVDTVLQPADLDDRVESWVNDVCSADPTAVRALKRLQATTLQHSLHEALIGEEAMHERLLASAEVRDNIGANYPESSS